MKISIIIPNYNGKELLKHNLPKLIRVTGDSEIIVVDDASTDGSIEILKGLFPQIRVIIRHGNGGFAKAVNDGVAAASNDLVYLLNSDAVPENGFMTHLIDHFKNPKVFAVGSLQKGTPWKEILFQGKSKGRFEKGFLRHLPSDIKNGNTLWVFGGAGMFRKDIWQQLGGMDNIYNPFYWEDIDLSYRAQKAGYKTLFEPKSIVYHFQQEGSIIKIYSAEYIKTISYRNQILFVWLNITDFRYLLQHFIYLPYYFITAIFRLEPAFIKATLLALLHLPKVLKHRRSNKKFNKISDTDLLKAYIT